MNQIYYIISIYIEGYVWTRYNSISIYIEGYVWTRYTIISIYIEGYVWTRYTILYLFSLTFFHYTNTMQKCIQQFNSCFSHFLVLAKLMMLQIYICSFCCMKDVIQTIFMTCQMILQRTNIHLLSHIEILILCNIKFMYKI